MAEIIADHVRANTLQLMILFLTVLIAILGIAQWMVKGVEDKRANEKSDAFEQEISDQATEILSLSQSLAESSEEIKRGQKQLRQQAETTNYANDLANSPRITFKWAPRNEGDPWFMMLTNSSDREFSKTSVDFYTTYKLFDDNGLVEEETNFRNSARSGVDVKGSFTPGKTVTIQVPTFPHTLNPQNIRKYKRIIVETVVGIRADEYLPLLDDYRHKIMLKTYYDSLQDYKPQYSTNDAQPLLIHREVKFSRASAQ
ncbi:hypothetical protein [Pseudovibrio sp. SCP19]|uniref:hypothetical protein n=1 Tax=Pseudovibrio sp. SCP19 TaxID=3141374 RepID=UPI003335D46A